MTRSVAENPAGAAADSAAPSRLSSSSLGRDIPFLMARARAAISGNANAALAAVDLKVRTYSILRLAGDGLNPSQRELSEFLNLDPSQIVALVDELQGRGMITRQPDPRDRRNRIIVITPAGRRLLRRATALAQAADDQVLAGLAPDERIALNGLLTKVVFPAGG